MTTMILKSREFRREREATWSELEALVTRVEKSGHSALSPDELARLPSLYRATLSSLAVARAISLDKNLLLYLEGLAARGYLCVYAKRSSFWPSLREFLQETFALFVYQQRRLLLFTIAVLMLGVVVGFWIVSETPERYYSFIGPEMAQGRNPETSAEDLLAVVKDGDASTSHLSNFASYLFTHNAKIGLLCFSLGALAGIPVIVLIFTNGLMLGALAAVYHARDLSLPFWGWILPHGITEFLAVCLSGVAGLMLARAVIFPEQHSRVDTLLLRGREASMVMLGAVLLFFVAALFEGFFRQLVTADGIRYSVALATLVFWVWFFVRKRGATHEAR